MRFAAFRHDASVGFESGSFSAWHGALEPTRVVAQNMRMRFFVLLWVVLCSASVNAEERISWRGLAPGVTLQEFRALTTSLRLVEQPDTSLMYSRDHPRVLRAVTTRFSGDGFQISALAVPNSVEQTNLRLVDELRVQSFTVRISYPAAVDKRDVLAGLTAAWGDLGRDAQDPNVLIRGYGLDVIRSTAPRANVRCEPTEAFRLVSVCSITLVDDQLTARTISVIEQAERAAGQERSEEHLRVR